AYYFLGDQTPGTTIGEVIADSPAAAAGLKPNDVILKIDGEEVHAFSDIVGIVSESAGKNLTFDIDRAGTATVLHITPESTVEDRGFYGKFTRGKIGAAPSMDASNYHDVSLPRAAVL